MNYEKLNFREFVKEHPQIRIPKIQRDYAQGRKGRKVQEIRKSFVHTLMLVAKGIRPTEELDFVYGYDKEETFEPLDGQQRITTLFLLHWMMGADFLKRSSDERRSVFAYETRHTSEEFCDELVQHEAIAFIKEAAVKTATSKKGATFTPASIIKGRDWFKWEWKYDPTVLSMLVMIDAIYEEMVNEVWKDETVKNACQNLKNIYKGEETQDKQSGTESPTEEAETREEQTTEKQETSTETSSLPNDKEQKEQKLKNAKETVKNSIDTACRVFAGWCGNLDHITFNRLDLGKFGLSNELFVKMNARGKQLSDFDKLKSTLEEELQLQQREEHPDGNALATDAEEAQWRTLMDGVWIDFFWHKYACDKMEIGGEENGNEEEKKRKAAERLEAAMLSEKQFKKLLLRLMALQLFENEKTSEELRNASYNIYEGNLDSLMTVYTDSLMEQRSKEGDNVIVLGENGPVTLNFRSLMRDFNLLIYKDADGKYKEISSLLSQESHIGKDEKTLFDSFLVEDVPNDVRLCFYSMLLFLRKFPAKKETEVGHDKELNFKFDGTIHQKWLSNLNDWVKAMRNILLNDNNTSRIDTLSSTFEATQSLINMIEYLRNFVQNNGCDMEGDDEVVLKFLRFIKASNKTYNKLDNSSLNEETEKAELKLNPADGADWKKLIDEYEHHEYLWGQIRCLLKWSNKDKDLFKDYGDRLVELLDYMKSYSQQYYAAILAFEPYFWQVSNRLYVLNRDRDNSFKRYLRDLKDDTLEDDTMQRFIDDWRTNHAGLNAADYVKVRIGMGKSASEAWVRCICEYPSIIDFAKYKRLYKEGEHVILAEFKTNNSHCFDPLLVYLCKLCEEKGMNEKDYKFYDSKADYKHAFYLSKDGHQYFVQWKGKDYSISMDNQPVSAVVYTAHDMIAYMKGVIKVQALP